MASTTSNSGRAIVTAGTKHEAFAGPPDICKVPGVPAPQPFPNWVKSEKLAKGATSTIFIAGKPVWTSAGELGPPSDPPHAGVAKGVKSGTYRGEAAPTSYSTDVFFEGNAVVRAFDTTTQNHQNTVGLVIPEALADMLRALAGYDADCLEVAATAGAAMVVP